MPKSQVLKSEKLVSTWMLSQDKVLLRLSPGELAEAINRISIMYAMAIKPMTIDKAMIWRTDFSLKLR